MVDWRQVVRARLSALRLTASAESALAEELAQHLEDLHRELVAGGVAEEEARRRAMSELDDVSPLGRDLDRSRRMPKHEPVVAGEATSRTYLDDLLRDLRHAGRAMRTHPAFALIVVMTLGLGIGANTTVFTLVNALILQPMPVRAASELVIVASTGSAGAAQTTLLPISYPNLLDYQAQNGAFSGLAGYARMRAVTWQGEGGSQALLSEFVTGEYFRVLGVGVATGRTFGVEANEPGGRAVAVMNYGAWQARFGGARDIVGRRIRLNNVVVTVVGVTPPGFLGVNGLVGPDLWLPFTLAEQLLPQEMRSAVTDRGTPLLQGVARLRPGVTLVQARADLRALAASLAQAYPNANEGETATVQPLGDALFGGASSMIRFAGAVLAMVAGVVLLIACSNVANLVLARSAARQQEMAIRVALGASRRRLVRQLLTESLCFGLLGGGVGLLIGFLSMKLLARSLPATGAFMTSRLDGAVMLYALLISLGTGLIFGVIPALSLSRAGGSDVLKDARAAGRRASRPIVANALLVGQVALSFLLLVMAAMFLRSIERAYAIDPGFAAARLAVFITNPGQAGYPQPQIETFYQDVRARVAQLPGIASVTWASNMPLFARPVSGLRVEDVPPQSRGDRSSTILNTVDTGYFETAGVAIEHGRAFTAFDRSTTLPVAIVNEKLAQELWPGRDALGKRVQAPGDTAMRTVVGVARTGNYSAVGEPPQRCVYVPLAQHPMLAMTLYVRSSGDPAPMVGAVGRAITAVDPNVLVSGVRTGAQIIDGSLFQARAGVALLTVFGVLALALASIGLYGILAHAVHQRRREIGVRIALGASQQSVRGLVVTQGMSLVGLGLAIGLVAALVIGPLLSRLLYGVGAIDAVSLAAAATALGGVALLACYLPARQASRLDPLVVLRQG